MHPMIERYATRYASLSTLVVGCAGAGATLVFGRAGWPSIVFAILLIAVAIIATRLAGETGRSDELLQQELSDRQIFSEALASVWTAQIEMSRKQSETAVSALASRFSAIVERVEQSVRETNDASDAMKGDAGLIGIFSQSERALGDVVTSLHDAAASKSEMVDKVREMTSVVSELEGMAQEVAAIAAQTTLLALNAAIEAARAGAAGRGFAVVAKEVRLLSMQSSETGARISQKIKTISERVTQTCFIAEESVRVDSQATRTSQATIERVLGDLRGVTDSLAHSSARLRDDSLGIQREIGESLVQLQFQDRVSQIMSHVKTNIQRFPAVLAEHRDAFQSEGDARRLTADALLHELQSSYAMKDEHVAHIGDIHATPVADDDITFF